MKLLPVMMELWKILLGFISLIAAFFYQKYQSLSRNLPKPDFDLQEFWGKGDFKDYKEDISIKPFKVAYSNEVTSTKLKCFYRKLKK